LLTIYKICKTLKTYKTYKTYKIKDHINLSDLNYLYNLYQNHLAKHPRKQKLKSQNQ